MSREGARLSVQSRESSKETCLSSLLASLLPFFDPMHTINSLAELNQSVIPLLFRLLLTSSLFFPFLQDERLRANLVEKVQEFVKEEPASVKV